MCVCVCACVCVCVCVCVNVREREVLARPLFCLDLDLKIDLVPRTEGILSGGYHFPEPHSAERLSFTHMKKQFPLSTCVFLQTSGHFNKQGSRAVCSNDEGCA